MHPPVAYLTAIVARPNYSSSDFGKAAAVFLHWRHSRPLHVRRFGFAAALNNGMVERFNARVSEVVNQTRFTSAADLESTLNQYVKTYNHLIPQCAPKHISPVQALKNWHAKKPELFKKQVYNQPGLDIYAARSSNCRNRWR